MKISDHLFNTKPQPGIPQAGKFLVADPFLAEYYFNHSVILLLEHSLSNGAMGIVMNRRIPRTLKEVVQDNDAAGLPENIPLYCGGPVSSDRLYYLHKIPELIRGSAPLDNGLYYGGDFKDVLEYLRDGLPTKDLIRFFAGYSGWSPGQLEEEIEAGSWAVENIPKRFKFFEGDEASYWTRMVKSMGEKYSGWLMHPMHPTDN